MAVTSFPKDLSVAANLDYMVIKDRDELTTNPPRRARNMNFRNRLFEIRRSCRSSQFGTTTTLAARDTTIRISKCTCSADCPVSIRTHKVRSTKNGELQYDGEWFDLRPWKTEGQEEEYSAFGLSNSSRYRSCTSLSTNFGEWVGSLAGEQPFTDYLDDISTNYTFIDPSEGQRYEFVHQTYQGLIDKVNAENTDSEFYPISIQNFQYVDGFNTKRGDPTHNDSYLTTQFTVGKVIRGRSKFYKSKYSWLKNRSTVRRTRAKF
jgi:hypothetical protein